MNEEHSKVIAINESLNALVQIIANNVLIPPDKVSLIIFNVFVFM